MIFTVYQIRLRGSQMDVIVGTYSAHGDPVGVRLLGVVERIMLTQMLNK